MGIFSKTSNPVPEFVPMPLDVTQIDEEISSWHTPVPTLQYQDQPSDWSRKDDLARIERITEDIGRITAEAIKADHEAAAAALEALGTDIVDRVRRIEVLKFQSQEMLEEINRLADKHREAGLHHASQVESTATDLAEARQMIDEMRKKMLA